jgi:2-polyprenyl-3-methyl-5-hydroxy-6-metoxy-1,4-benzoquinol methylase
MSAPSASRVNREFYDQPLPGRDDYWRKMAAPRSRVAQLLALIADLSPARIADLGPGGGQLLSEIHARQPGIQLCGIDIAVSQIADNARRLPTIEWHAADLDGDDRIPRALWGTFDIVIASELIEHMDHPEALLRNARRLARPGTGRLLLSTQSGPLRETERRVGHRRHWSQAEMQQALIDAGWVPIRVWNCGFPFHDLSKWYANLDPGASMARYAEKAYGPRENFVCYALRTAFRFNSRRRGAQLFAVAKRPSDGAA